MEHETGLGSRIWSGILNIAGVKFEHQWSSKEYLAWLEEHGWEVTFSREMAARITLMYAECKRKIVQKEGSSIMNQYGSIGAKGTEYENWIQYLKDKGISEVHYEGDQDRMLPKVVIRPYCINGTGILWGRK